MREEKSVYPRLTLSASVSAHGPPLFPPGASQATNRENIQKAISRLDEDLTTLGQMSKLSENLGFPHQVCALCLRLGEWGSGGSQTLLREREQPFHLPEEEVSHLCHLLEGGNTASPQLREVMCSRPKGGGTPPSLAEGGERTHHVCWGRIQATSSRGGDRVPFSV